MVTRQLRSGIPAILIVLILMFTPFTVSASQITDDLKNTIDEIIGIVTDESLKNDKRARRGKIRRTIAKRFNYRQMVMRSLAKSWNDRTPQEREEFIQLFKKLLENSYARKIESYRDEKINYLNEIIKGNYAQVETEIVRKDGNIAVDYRLIKDNGDWKVYDFVIEGVSMIRNYRSQFSRIIQKDSYNELVKKLSAKIDELELDDGNGASENL
ncbi:MAG: ABC transporter substrate-binding protein [Nitrospinota bacterium]|nr:ABC transporter substrate-binding protein [Nitrospinota bacterium]